MFFLPRRWRLICFFIVTPWEIGVILTANYTFLNYLVLVLGFLLLDDYFLRRFLPAKWKASFLWSLAIPRGESQETSTSRRGLTRVWLSTGILLLSWVSYSTTAQLLAMFSTIPFPTAPIVALDPLRIGGSARTAHEQGPQRRHAWHAEAEPAAQPEAA